MRVARSHRIVLFTFSSLRINKKGKKTTTPQCKPVILERFVQNVQWEPGNRNNL